MARSDSGSPTSKEIDEALERFYNGDDDQPEVWGKGTKGKNNSWWVEAKDGSFMVKGWSAEFHRDMCKGAKQGGKGSGGGKSSKGGKGSKGLGQQGEDP